MYNVTDIKVGFLGFGNMGQAIADGLLYTKTLQPDQIYACGGSYGRLKNNAEVRGIHACHDAKEVVEASDVLVIAVKPGMVEPVLSPLGALLKEKMILSVVANYLFEDYEKILPEGCHHLSTIPNTPVSVGEGITICEKKHSLTEEGYRIIMELLSGIGLAVEVDGDQVNIASTISGCAPAFASMFTEALADAGVMYGLPRKMAYQLAGQMITGTGKLMTESGKHPGEMKDHVCSPGGTTIVGVAALEKCGLRAAVIEAVEAVMDKYGIG